MDRNSSVIRAETLAMLEAYIPLSQEEACDQRLTLAYAREYPETVLLRENEIAHITSSGFIVNATCDRVLMVHHNLRNTWAWTGGHADGENDLLGVAVREAWEEAGIVAAPETGEIAGIDILYMPRHMRRGCYVNTHLHLNISYILVANEHAPLTVNPDENTAVRWFREGEIASPCFGEGDVASYKRLLARAKYDANMKRNRA